MSKRNNHVVPNEFFGITKEKLLEICMISPFPGNTRWEADHPIWDCNVAGHPTPRDAWADEKMVKKAIDNLYWILDKSINIGPKFYPEFAERHKQAFEAGGADLLRCVLTRFTVAKIAPKVTALRPATFEQIIEQSGIDLSSGVYCPMAGFGGIIEGAKRWFKKNGLPEDIEAYDINPNFCAHYGWKQRDALAQVVKTDKVLIACPPFGTETERWKGTPEEMYYDFEDWCELLKKHVIAKDYIFIGPEKQDVIPKYQSGKERHSLFRKKVGVMYYPEYSVGSTVK